MTIQNWLNEMTNERRVFDLGMELYHGMPHHPFHAPFMYEMAREHGDLVFGQGVTSAYDVFGMSCHTGTHFDGLGHFAKNLCLHRGRPAAMLQSKTGGISELGIQHIAPIVRRGVLLDVAGTLRVPALDSQHVIGPSELEAAARAAKVDLRPGDVVMIRTGWIKHWPDQRRYYSIQTGTPGINLEAAKWATDQGVFCLGSDNFGVEYIPAPDDAYPVHVHCLIEKGVHIMEVVNLEEISKAGVHEFLLVMATLKIRGGTASPVRPLAIA